MAASPRQANVIVTATIKFATTQAGLAAAPLTYECVTTAAGFVASANLVDVPATGCAPKSQTAAASSWALDIAWLQDWNSPGGGLSGFMFTNDAKKMWVEVTPTSPVLPAAVAEVTIISGPVYGEFGTILTATASLAASAKPTITLPVVLAADEAAADDEGAELVDA